MSDNQPLTWNEDGDLVPLSAQEELRQKELADERAASNPPLPDNPVLSDKESRKLVYRDAARLMDVFFKDNTEMVVQFLLPVFGVVLGVFARSIWAALIFIFPGLLLIAWRLWVYLRIEKKRPQ